MISFLLTNMSFNMYTNPHSTTYFLVTNTFIHIQNIYSFTFRVKLFIFQSSQVKPTPQDPINEFIIRKLYVKTTYQARDKEIVEVPWCRTLWQSFNWKTCCYLMYTCTVYVCNRCLKADKHEGFRSRSMLQEYQQFHGYTSSSGAEFPPRKMLHDT